MSKFFESWDTLMYQSIPPADIITNAPVSSEILGGESCSEDSDCEYLLNIKLNELVDDSKEEEETDDEEDGSTQYLFLFLTFAEKCDDA